MGKRAISDGMNTRVGSHAVGAGERSAFKQDFRKRDRKEVVTNLGVSPGVWFGGRKVIFLRGGIVKSKKENSVVRKVNR